MIRRRLEEIVDFSDFSYRNYLESEKTVLTPQLRALGYFNIVFVDGEADNLGPLNRLCRCKNRNGKKCELYYG